MTKVIFSHGKESGPWGSKIKRLATTAESLGFDVDSIDYQGISDPEQRVAKLLHYLAQQSSPFILVGSSMGGYVSLVAAKQSQPHGIFLLAPALFLKGYQIQDYPTACKNIELVHGWFDDVVPIENSITYAKRAQCVTHLVNGDHRLNSVLDDVDILFQQFLKKL